jgi:hypothetical protein
MASLPPPQKYRAFTAGNAGASVRPLVGGKLYTYAAGTTTPKVTYTDATETTPNTNPVILNSRGEADVWLGLGSYKFVLTDSTGVTESVTDGIKSSGQFLQEALDAAAGSDAALRSELASTINASDGAGMVGFNPELNYVTGGLGWYVKNSTPAIIANWFGITGDGTTNWTTQIQSVIDLAAAAKRPVLFLNGTYVTGTLNLVDKRISLYGESTLGTILKATAGFTGTLIDMRNTTNNGGDTFERIENMTILGTYGNGSFGINQALVSRGSFKDLIVQGFDTGVRQVNTFCFLGTQVEIKDCRTNLHLVGSNHNTEYVRLGCVGFGNSWGGPGTGVKVENNGADGLQSSLAFRGTDVEFGTGDAFSIACTGTAVLDNCYTEAANGTIVKCLDGTVNVVGGEHIIKDSTGFLVDVVGGNATVTFDDRASLASDGTTRIFASLIKTGGSGTVVFARTNIWQKVITTNVGTLPPNLGRSMLPTPFLKAPGRYFTGTGYTTGVVATVTTGDTRRWTATTAGPIGVLQTFTQQPRVGANCALVIVYKSNTTHTVTTVAAGGQTGAITTIGTLPNSSGARLVAVFPEAKITDATQLAIEFWKPSWAIGDYLEIEEAWMYDGGAIPNGQLSLG